jgi:hypothetical protein
MSLLDIDVSGAQEPKVVEAGSEVQIRIIDVRVDTNKHGQRYFQPRYDIVNEPLAKDFTDYLEPTNDSMDEKTKRRAEWKIRTFLESFNLPLKGRMDPTQWQGLVGWAILGIKVDDTYGEQNKIMKYVSGPGASVASTVADVAPDDDAPF